MPISRIPMHIGCNETQLATPVSRMNEHEQNSELVIRLLNSRLLQTDWVLWFLLVLLGICVLVIAWKTVYFVMNTRRTAALRHVIAQLVGGGSLDDFQAALEEQEGVEAGVLKHALRFSANGADTVEQQMDVALISAKQRMEFGHTFLGTVGSNAPFVGLYGTVGGIIRAFRDLSSSAEAGISAVIAGIAEALVATAVGLLVAIPAVVAFNYLQRQVKKAVGASQALNQQVLFRLRAEADE
jgi:biopolymer transport protein ExbB